MRSGCYIHHKGGKYTRLWLSSSDLVNTSSCIYLPPNFAHKKSNVSCVRKLLILSMSFKNLRILIRESLFLVHVHLVHTTILLVWIKHLLIPLVRPTKHQGMNIIIPCIGTPSTHTCICEQILWCNFPCTATETFGNFMSVFNPLFKTLLLYSTGFWTFLQVF